jgi:hypothetical protein
MNYPFNLENKTPSPHWGEGRDEGLPKIAPISSRPALQSKEACVLAISNAAR